MLPEERADCDPLPGPRLLVKVHMQVESQFI